MGKIAVALYAILAINVMASVLEPAKEFLQSFCLEPEETWNAKEEDFDIDEDNDNTPASGTTKQKKRKQQKKKKTI